MTGESNVNEHVNKVGKGWSAGKEFVKRDLCLLCGNKFYAAPCVKARSEMSGKFCSRVCGAKYQYKDHIPKPPKPKKPRPKRAVFACKMCGADTHKIFCNRECYARFRKINKSPNIVSMVCKNCNKEFRINAARVKVGEGLFCSISCSRILLIKSGNFKGMGNAVGGKRQDLGNMYFRSRWEANFARYLNFLIKVGEVISWQYEPDTFRFEKIKRGIQSYTPDFKVAYSDGRNNYVEIKGYIYRSKLLT